MTQAGFDFAAAIKARPDYGQREAFYGSYTYTEAGKGWVNPDPKWEAANLVLVPLSQLPHWPLYQGVTPVKGVRVHQLVAPVLVATWAEVVRRGLHTRVRSFDGAFAARHMTNDPARPLSNHAKGSALDFDAGTNGFGVPLARATLDREFARVWEECGWSWGGRWNPCDAMHFEWLTQEPSLRPEWQDAMGRPAPAAPKGVRVYDGAQWRGVPFGERQEIELSRGVVLVVNATDPDAVMVRLK